MTRHVGILSLAGLALAVLCAGCQVRPEARFTDSDRPHYVALASQTIDVPNDGMDPGVELVGFTQPDTVANKRAPVYWNLSLQEAVHLALANSKIMRDAGGRVLNAPGAAPSIYDPALQELNPQAGMQRALAAFDAQFTTSLFFNRNERTFNNAFFGGGTRDFLQNTAEGRIEVTKRAATGDQFTIRSITNYDRNNSPNNLFMGGYDQVFEAEFRHSFLQGGGIEFNRIAGPGAQVGQYNGIVIARINGDIGLADFELSVRNLIADVERTYWGLYLAYRELDSVIEGRDNTLQIWERVRTLVEEKSSKPEREMLVRDQYYEAQAQVENILNGSPVQGATNQLYNPVTAINAGVLGTERRLRFLLGIPNRDGRLIRPLDEPALIHQVFDWEEALAMGLTRRVELRRQRFAIQRREMELIAARNFLMGRLDAVGRFGVRGFGDRLLGDDGTPNRSAWQDLMMGDLEQWELGIQYQTTIGNRTGHMAVRHAELQLMRERALYRDQELQVANEVGGAFAELERAYSVTRLSYNRRIAAHDYMEKVLFRFKELGEAERVRPDVPDQHGVRLEFLLDALRRTTQSDALYFRALVDHTMSISSMHYYRGTFLDFHNVRLAERAWSAEAHASAERDARRFIARQHLENKVVPCPTVAGEFPQAGEVPVVPEPIPTPAADPTDALPADPVPAEPKELPPPTDLRLPESQILPPLPELNDEPAVPSGPLAPPAAPAEPRPLESPARPLKRLQVNVSPTPVAPVVGEVSSDENSPGEIAPTVANDVGDATRRVSRIPTQVPSGHSEAVVADEAVESPARREELYPSDPPKPAARKFPFALPRLPNWFSRPEPPAQSLPMTPPTIVPGALPAPPANVLPPVVRPSQAGAVTDAPASWPSRMLPLREGHSNPYGEPRVSSIAPTAVPLTELPLTAPVTEPAKATAASPAADLPSATPVAGPTRYPTPRPIRRKVNDAAAPAAGPAPLSEAPPSAALPSAELPSAELPSIESPAAAMTPPAALVPQTAPRGPRRVRIDP